MYHSSKRYEAIAAPTRPAGQHHGSASIIDQRASTAAHLQLKQKIDDSQSAGASRAAAQLVQNTAIPNNTGLPDNLKAGIENLSGMSMDHVKVHYNSAQPAQLNAHAYAQGSDIHVAPGQEKHLPHEAWHVVQQAQGRVQPTVQLKTGVAVNDDAGLESEADMMGARALQLQRAAVRPNSNCDGTKSEVSQLQERTTSIHTKVGHTNTFRKGMEIVDSTSPHSYVHISRNATLLENDIDIQQQPHYFNGLAEPTKRSRIDLAPALNPHVNLGAYTRANNAHITLEGRYARVMQSLAVGFQNLDAIKSGSPVDASFNNLNFGSSTDHGGAHASDYGIYTYIHNWAEDAEEYARQRPENFEGENNELLAAIDRVHDETSAFTTRLITDSPLNNLASEDFVHYAGEEWSPILPEDLL